MAQRIEAALHNVAQDIWEVRGGYNAVFLSFAGVAIIAVTVVYSKMPEAKDIQTIRTVVEGSR
jgi:hypothetical protein